MESKLMTDDELRALCEGPSGFCWSPRWIAAARDAIPMLLAEKARLRAALEEIEVHDNETCFASWSVARAILNDMFGGNRLKLVQDQQVAAKSAQEGNQSALADERDEGSAG